MTQNNDDLTIQIEDVSRWTPHEDQPGNGILLHTTRGDIHTIVHSNPDPDYRTDKAIIFVWGARGGFDGPAGGIYARLAEDLKYQFTSIRIDYRLPNVIHECVLDTIAGLYFLSVTGHTDVALVGHSFGGAVVILTGSLSPMVKAVAALSSQTGGLPIRERYGLSPRPLLLAHGGADTRLPPSCSEQIYEWASEPKEKVIFPGAEHGLVECQEELDALLKDWLLHHLANPPEIPIP